MNSDNTTFDTPGDTSVSGSQIQLLGDALTPTSTNDLVGETYVTALAGTPQNLTFTVTDPNGNALPNASIAAAAQEITLQSLTVVSNSAIQISGTNWGVVKTPDPNDYVIIQATLSDTNISISNLPSSLQWTGGQAVSGNPLQRLVSKTNSVETNVMVTLGSSSLSLNVWIIWSSVSIQATNQTPSNAPAWPAYCPGTALGMQYYSRTNGAIIGYEKVCIIATLTPPGINSVLTNGWGISQNLMAHEFENGTNFTRFYFDDWQSDFTQANYSKHETSIPDSGDQIYAIDAPNIAQFGTNNTSFDKYDNFYDWATWNSQIISDTNNFWHFKGTWNASQTPYIQNAEVNTGLIVLPTSP